MKKLLLLALPAILAISTACTVQPPTTTTPVVQTPGTVLVEGDSVTFQAVYGGGDLSDMQINAVIGSTATKCVDSLSPGCVPAVTNVPLRVGEAEVDNLIWALGLNDANPVNGGWTTEDVLYWTDTFNKVPAASCIVLVMPALGPGAATGHYAQIDALRTWIAGYQRANGGPVVKIDWKTFANDPAVMDDDGVHLQWVKATGTEDAMIYAAGATDTPPQVDPYAADVRADFYRNGLAQCPA